MSTNNQSLKMLWQELPSETVVFTKEQLQSRARKFQTKHKRRDRLEYISYGLFFALVAYMLTVQSDWQDWVASGLATIGAIVVIWNYSQLAKVKFISLSNSGEELIESLRLELTRQRDASASMWRWYVLPFMPFTIFVVTYRWVEEGATLVEITDMRFSILLLTALIIAFISAFVLWKFLCAARYQRELDKLNNYYK